jgi:nondiscriminating glutamyl-tRNA synthetase
MSVVTRMAPSPTGQMHIGTVRTALFNYLFAKQQGGTYFVRIEDTDRERNKKEWLDGIVEDFSWAGLTPDVVYIQSEHLPRHKELLHSLIEKGSAYVSKEPSKDDPTREVEVVRLKNPGTSITFNDLIRGDVTFDTAELGDFVIARSIDDPLYHFAVVVDDGDAGVTHVLRAEEHISNTPRQILIQEALGLQRPIYGHFPLILAPDRSKLSKRKHGASVENYRAQGFLPEALINYLALLGWNPGDDREVFSLAELVNSFDISRVQKSGAIFDIEKLRWFNRHYLHTMNDDDFVSEMLRVLQECLDTRQLPWNEDMARKIAPLIRERISVWDDLKKMCTEGELDYFFAEPSLAAESIPYKKESAVDASKHLWRTKELLAIISDHNFSDPDTLKSALWEYASAEGRGNVLWPLRYALSGKERSPDPFTIASIVGKSATLRRIDEAIVKLRGR